MASQNWTKSARMSSLEMGGMDHNTGCSKSMLACLVQAKRGSWRSRATLLVQRSVERRCWAVSSGVVSQRQDRTELRVSDSGACHTIHSHLDTFASRFQAERAKVAPRK